MSADDKARETLNRYAECELKFRREPIERALGLSPWSKRESDALQRIAADQCLYGANMEIPPYLFRGALFEALYRDRFATKPATLPANPPDFTDGATPPFAQDVQTDVAIRQFGDCVVRRDTYDAQMFVLAKPGTVTESAALTRLVPNLGPCGLKGSTWQLNKGSLSAVLAEVLYREQAVALETKSDAH